MFVVTGRLRSTALYGSIAFLVCIFLPDVGLSALAAQAASGTGAQTLFAQFLRVSPVAYLLLMLLHVVMCAIDNCRRGESESWVAEVAGALAWDLACPLLDIYTPLFVKNDARGVTRVLQYFVAGLCFIWAALLIAFLIYGFFQLL